MEGFRHFLQRVTGELRSGPRALMAAAVVVFAGLLAFGVDWGRLLGPAMRSRTEIRSLKSPIQEAESLGLDWDSVMKDPSGSAGKPVYWKLTQNQPNDFRYEGNPGKVVRWQGSGPTIRTGASGRPPYLLVLARIQEVSPPNVVVLELLDRR